MNATTAEQTKKYGNDERLFSVIYNVGNDGIPAVVAHQGKKNRPGWCHVYVRLIGNTRRTVIHAARITFSK